MKKYIYITYLIALLIPLIGCQDDDASFGDIVAPSNVQISAEIVGADTNNPFGDGSGFVNLTASADNALNYNFSFGDGTSEVAPSGKVTHRFSLVGTNAYTVVVNAVGVGGIQSSTSITIEVFSSFDDLEAKELLSGGPGSSKTWYWAAAEVGHLGVGPANDTFGSGYWFPEWYAAQPFEKGGDPESSCIYEDELIFSMDANDQLTYELNNNGQTYFNGAHEGVVGGSAGYDFCYDFDTSGVSIVSLSPSDELTVTPDPDFSSRGTVLNFSDNNFMGYYVGSSSYEILELTETTLIVRTYDPLNAALAWYHTFSTSAPSAGFESDYNTLIWSDEFDQAGAPNPANWTYDLGGGGWGNQESQVYTNDAENVIVEDGLLKITAKADGIGGYTSARIKSENLFEFTYGRVEVRAKLPEGGGTWPAIWMLGANFDTVGWPDCGEIDIMEHVGNNPNVIHGTLHFPGNSGGNAVGNSTTVATATTEFHDYTVEWSPSAIKFVVDNEVVYHTFANTSSVPYNHDFFLILNVAMGGSFGGTIDPSFTESAMEIDYVRVYQ